MYTHILIPTDGSELAQKGVDHGLSLARALGSKVTVITVTEPYPHLYDEGWTPALDDIGRFEEEKRKGASELLAKVEKQAGKLGVAIEVLHAPDAAPATTIVDTAKEKGCNLIVMSSHGRRGISRVLLGSQTSEVLAHTHVPVLVVR